MKKLLGIMIVLCLLIGTCALSEGADFSTEKAAGSSSLQSFIIRDKDKQSHEYDQMVEQALEVLIAGWKAEYDQCAAPGVSYYLDIRGVRVIEMKEGLVPGPDNYYSIFQNARYIVEFLFLDDYLSDYEKISGHNVGYLDYSGMNNCVLVDQQNNMTLARRVLDIYRGRTYNGDYSSIVEKVTDCGDRFNQVIEFKYIETPEPEQAPTA